MTGDGGVSPGQAFSSCQAQRPSILTAIHVYSELPVSPKLIMSSNCGRQLRTPSATDINAPSGIGTHNLVALRQFYNILKITIHPTCCHPGRHVRHEGLKPSSQPGHCWQGWLDAGVLKRNVWKDKMFRSNLTHLQQDFLSLWTFSKKCFNWYLIGQMDISFVVCHTVVLCLHNVSADTRTFHVW